jgi:uncharacterized membrane protein YcfT
MNTRIAYLDFMRGLMVILVVVYHACCWGYWSDGQIAPIYHRVNPVLANVRMPILMLISGYLIRNISDKDRRTVISRIAQLAWLYALWMPVNLLAHIASDSATFTIADLPAQIVLQWLNPTSEMWFIWALMILTGLAYLLREVPRYPVLVVLVLANGLTYQFGWFQDQLAATSMPRLGIFFFGGIMFHQEIKIFISSRFSVRMLAVLVAAAIGVHISETLIHEGLGIYAFQGAESILVSITVLYMCRMLAWVQPSTRFFTSVGRNTLPIYLAHVPVILMLRGTMPGEGVWLYVSPLLLATCGVGGGLLLHRLARGAGAGWLYSKPSWFDGRHAYRALDRVRASLHMLAMPTGR